MNPIPNTQSHSMKRKYPRRKSSTFGSGNAALWMTKFTELGMATLQVMAHRVARMAKAGPMPSARDQAEFQRMWTEKSSAFVESWQAMTAQAVQQQQAAALAMASSWFNPMAWLTGPSRAWVPSAGQAASKTLDIMNAGLSPVHRKAVSNARRLGKTSHR